MATFHTDFVVANILNRAKSATVAKAMVDTGNEYSWVLTSMLERLGIRREKKDMLFQMANGQNITRSVGFAIVRVQDAFTVDEVVFGEPGDMNLLGARSLEGLNLTIDPRRKRLVAAGPQMAAESKPRRQPKKENI
jgi:predicted aspartyl protease